MHSCRFSASETVGTQSVSTGARLACAHRPPKRIDSVVAARLEHGIDHLAAWHSELLSVLLHGHFCPVQDADMGTGSMAHKLMVWLPKALMKTFDPRKKFFALFGPT